ncbi:hypothetical protein D3C86_1688630 [compost metagenome]
MERGFPVPMVHLHHIHTGELADGPVQRLAQHEDLRRGHRQAQANPVAIAGGGGWQGVTPGAAPRDGGKGNGEARGLSRLSHYA